MYYCSSSGSSGIRVFTKTSAPAWNNFRGLIKHRSYCTIDEGVELLGLQELLQPGHNHALEVYIDGRGLRYHNFYHIGLLLLLHQLGQAQVQATSFLFVFLLGKYLFSRVHRVDCKHGHPCDQNCQLFWFTQAFLYLLQQAHY